MIQLPNISDTRGSLQILLQAINRLELRIQANESGAGGATEMLARNGWLGVIRESGPNGEDNFASDDPRYWVERLEAKTDGTFNTVSVMDRHDQILSPIDYVGAVNLAEVQYLDGGGEATSTGTIGLLTGRIVRVFSLLGGETFHYFDAGDAMIRCRLDHLGDGVYDAYAWGDVLQEHEKLGESLVPQYRPLGTTVVFTQYAETGWGYFDPTGDFVLVNAIEERYNLGPC